MNKYVIISSNGNPSYEWYIQIVTWAWKKLGWTAIVMRPFPSDIYREVTITQCIRLYAAHLEIFKSNDLIMTSDADMIPLSDYWKPDPKDITTYGHDLTGYKHVPMCYIAMTTANWREVMGLNDSIVDDMLRDLKDTQALSDIKHGDPGIGYWGVDQDIITERLSHHKVFNIDRGQEPGLPVPKGRMDRNCMYYPSTLIDFHAPHDPLNHIAKIQEVITLAFGECPPL